MPLYEYQCESCDHRFELIRKFSDPPLEKCPKCGGAVRKLMSSPAIQFKGSGFYITDYARKDSSSSKSDGGGGGSTESVSKAEKSDKSESSDKSDKSDKSEKTAASGSGDKATASTKAPADPVK